MATRDAAAYCGVGADLFLREAPFAAFRIGARVLWDRNVIDAWIDTLSGISKGPYVDEATLRREQQAAFAIGLAKFRESASRKKRGSKAIKDQPSQTAQSIQQISRTGEAHEGSETDPLSLVSEETLLSLTPPADRMSLVTREWAPRVRGRPRRRYYVHIRSGLIMIRDPNTAGGALEILALEYLCDQKRIGDQER